MKGLWLRLRGRWYRYGYACVSFGRPLSLRAYLVERGADLRVLAGREVCRVASVLLANGPHGLSSLELKGAGAPSCAASRRLVHTSTSPVTIRSMR